MSKDRRHISETEKEWLALFIGTMQMRTPAGRYLSENRITPLITQIMKEAAADATKFRSFIEENYHLPSDEGFDLEEIRQDILAGRGEALSARPDLKQLSIIEVGKMVAQVLLEMKWQTIYSENQELFLTSDDPVVTHLIDEKSNRLHLRMGVATPGVNIWFPLCRTVCLRIIRVGDSGEARGVNAGIRYLNKMTIMYPERWVFASERSDRIKALFDNKGGQFNVRTVDLRFEGRKY